MTIPFIVAIKIYITFLVIYSMTLGANKNKSFRINVRGINIPSKNEVILLGITIGLELKFNKHIEDICKRASLKLHALRRIRKYLRIEKARILANAFIESQFNYARLIWMFASKMAIKKICKLHHRTIKVVYNEYDKSYEKLLEMNKSASIHQRHLQCLAMEVYKSLMHLTPSWWRLLSYRNHSIDLRSKSMDRFLYDNDLRHERVKTYNLRRLWIAFARAAVNIPMTRIATNQTLFIS